MSNNIRPPDGPENKIIVQATPGKSITLSKGYGCVTDKVTSDHTAHLITTPIPANQIVVLSLRDITSGCSDHESVRLRLVRSNGIEVTPNSSQWHPTTRMNYFRTSGGSQQYTAQVYSDEPMDYTLDVSVVNAATFIPCNTLFYGGLDANSTYLMSNYPEVIESSGPVWSESKKYSLVRGKVNGCCRIVWEHYNKTGASRKFGVLLWNKGSTPVKVSLTSRSVKTGTHNPACLDIWVDCLNAVIQKDDSGIQAGETITLPAYSATTPDASALWVALNTVSDTVAGPGFFNGQVTLMLKNQDGSNYLGNNVFCDTYIMDAGSVSKVKSEIANNIMYNEYAANTLRGSGTGASLYARLQEVSVSPDAPYSLLITGADTPLVQIGELISLTTYKQSGAVNQTRKNGENFGVVYRFDISKFTSAQQIKGTLKFNSRTNPNIFYTPGIYVVGYLEGSTVFKKLLYLDESFTFSSNLSRNKQVYLTVVVGCMSSPPLEITFCN